MAKIAARSEEVRKRSEFKCMPRLCNILDSQNGCSSPEIISTKLINDYPRKLNHGVSFDEECRKIQNAAELGNSTVKANSVRSLRDVIREDTEILKQKTEGTKLCEDLPMSILLEKHERIDLNMLQIQMSAKDFLDQIVADRKPDCNEGMKRIETKPFSNALQVLHSDKDLFIELLSEPLCMPQKCIKSLQNCSVSNRRLALKREVQNGSVASFSVREMKRKLKHTFRSRRGESDLLPNFSTSAKLSHKRSIFGRDCIHSGVETKNPLSFGTNAKTKEKLGKNRGLKAGREPPLVPGSEAVRKKIDFSSDSFDKKHGADEDLSARSNLQKQWRVLSSFGVNSCLSPRRESHYISGSEQVSWSPCRLSREMSSSLVPSTDEEEAREAIVSPTPNMKFNDTSNVVVTDNINRSERAARIKLHKDENGGVMHSIRALITENETFSNTVHDFPSSPTLDMSDNNKYQEERQSPVSVLDQFFAEDSASPSNVTFQSARGPLKPRRLRFEEHGSSSSSQDYTISNYVRLLFEASSLNWDQLSAIRLQSEHLLHPSLFDQGQFLMFDSHFHTRLLFDHVNEVLLETKRSHFASPYWPAFAKPRICSLPLEEAVVDEIMRESEFYLLPRTQRRTLDQLLAVDFSGPRSRPDFRAESEQIMAHISEDILEESILDVVLQLYS